MTTQTRMDGFLGAVQGLLSFKGRSPSAAASPAQTLYDTDGLAARIVDRPAEDALSSGIEVDGDQELQEGEGGIVLNEIDRLNAVQHLIDAVRWARLHGAGTVLILADDGQMLTDPLNLSRLRRINDLISYPATAIHPDGALEYTDPAQANYGEPVYYRLTPRRGRDFVVHESRLLKVSGDPLSYTPGAAHELPWIGRSALDAVAAPLKRYRDAMFLSRMILERKQQPVHKMAGMAKTLEELGVEGEQIITRRLSMVDLARGVMTTVAVDGDDDFSVLDSAVGGIDSLLAAFRLDLCAADGTPVPILFGEGLSGLGNSGAGERGIYSARITTIRERSIRPALERLVSIIWAQSEVKVTEPEHWRVKFKPLFEPTEAEAAKAELDRANAQKTRVEALELLSTGQHITPEEGRSYVSRAMPEYGVSEEPVAAVLPDDDEAP